MFRSLKSLLVQIAFAKATIASGALLRGSFHGVFAEPTMGEVVSGEFVVNTEVNAGTDDSILFIQSQQWLIDGAPLVSPVSTPGWIWVVDNARLRGMDEPVDALCIYLGWASPSSFKPSNSLDIDWSPPLGPVSLVGYGVGLEFTGPTSWFEDGYDLRSVLTNNHLAEVETWIEVQYAYGGFVFGDGEVLSSFVLTEFQLVPEPSSALGAFLIAGLMLTRPSRSLRWRFSRA